MTYATHPKVRPTGPRVCVGDAKAAACLSDLDEVDRLEQLSALLHLLPALLLLRLALLLLALRLMGAHRNGMRDGEGMGRGGRSGAGRKEAARSMLARLQHSIS